MDDLISRQSAIAHAISGRTRELEGEKWIRVSEVRESLQTIPSAERHGRWMQDGTGYRATCSICKENTDRGWIYHYCPNCGSLMVTEEEE